MCLLAEPNRHRDHMKRLKKKKKKVTALTHRSSDWEPDGSVAGPGIKKKRTFIHSYHAVLAQSRRGWIGKLCCLRSARPLLSEVTSSPTGQAETSPDVYREAEQKQSNTLPGVRVFCFPAWFLLCCPLRQTHSLWIYLPRQNI